MKLVKFLKSLVTLYDCLYSENRFFINLFKTSKLALLEYIKDQLLFNDSVTLPGLGSFEIRKTASRIQDKIIIPPAVQVIFNPGKTLDDGALAKSIAAAEEISKEEATQKLLEYIDEILFALNKGEEYIFPGFGKLFRDSENVFRFDKDPDYKIELESYGLESFELDPIEDLLKEVQISDTEKIVNETAQVKNKQNSSKTKVEKVEVQNNFSKTNEPTHKIPLPKENKNNRNIFWILTGAVIVILISFVIIRMTTDLLDGTGLSVFSKGQSDKPEIFPEDENWDVESNLNGDLGEAIDSMTLQENALNMQESSEPQDVNVSGTSEYVEFHIIAGSFKDKEKAGILQQALTLQGYPALVIQQGDQLYRVSAISFKDKGKGLEELSRFKQKTKNNAAWLLGLK
jgi:nucleoid DNA-binding protein